MIKKILPGKKTFFAPTIVQRTRKFHEISFDPNFLLDKRQLKTSPRFYLGDFFIITAGNTLSHCFHLVKRAFIDHVLLNIHFFDEFSTSKGTPRTFKSKTARVNIILQRNSRDFLLKKTYQRKLTPFFNNITIWTLD